MGPVCLTKPARAAAAATLVLLLALPQAGAEGRIPNAGWSECDQDLPETLIRCHLYAEALLTLLGCDGATCELRVESGGYLTAQVPSLLYVETFVTVLQGGGGSICLGPKAVRDAVGDPTESCGQVCESFAVGWSAFCTGDTTRAFDLPVGECAGVSVLTYVTWGYMAQSTYVHLMYDVCRTGADSFDVDPWVWW